jgi:hypothetical protein
MFAFWLRLFAVVNPKFELAVRVFAIVFIALIHCIFSRYQGGLIVAGPGIDNILYIHKVSAPFTKTLYRLF